MKKTLSIVMMSLIVLSTFSILTTQIKAEPDLGAWVSKANMPTARTDTAAVALEGKIYVIGGSDRSGGGTERRTSIVEVYDPATDMWSTGTPLPAGEYPGAVVVNEKIYVVGDDGRTFSYDPIMDEWTEHTSMPVSGRGGVGEVNGKIYVTKGSPTYPSGEYWTYCYDPSSDTWTPRAGIPYHRSIESFASLGGKLYAIGGADPSLGPRIEPTRVDIYDPETDSWELDAIPRMTYHRTHLEPTTPVIDGKMYVIGGWNGYHALSACEVYDLSTNTWTTLAPMPTARYSLATAVVSGRIYAMGGDYGGAGGHPQSVNEEFTPPAARAPSQPEDLWATPSLSWIHLIWSTPSDPGSSEIDNYFIYRGTAPGEETFLDSVDSSTLTYVDFSVSVDTVYYYRVTATNSFGESLPSNEVRCATEQSVKGIESIVTLNDATTTAPGRDIFSIQQNFHIHRMSDDVAIYWVQNIIYVCKIAGLVSILGEMEIFDATTTPYTPIEYSPGLDLITSVGAPYPELKTLPITVVLSSTIDGNTLNMINDCWAFSFSLPEETYIGAYPLPETVMVGWSIALSPIADFSYPTSGHMDTYVRIGSDTWLKGDNEIVAFGEAQTAEKSTGLEWSFNGDFEYEDDSTDQGLRFLPNYDGPIVFPPSPSPSSITSEATIISLSCPANLSLFDSQGRHLGYNETTGEMDAQIPWAFHMVSPEDDLMVICYPNDKYNLMVAGTGDGDYVLQLASMNENGIISTVSTSRGSVADGSFYVYSIDTTGEIVTIAPDPVAELEYLKEFINGLPDDAFDKPKLANQRKKALFNKNDEVILKVEAENYTDAINKLFHDIRAKMDGDSTPRDWIVDPRTRSNLCVIIDHITSSIETLQQE